MVVFYGPGTFVSGKTILHLPNDGPVPPIPFELQTYITPQEWDGRIRAIMRTSKRYSKRALELIWVITAFIATFLLPFALFQLIFDALHENGSKFKSRQESYFQARLITFGVFVGTCVFFWTPIIVWKSIGRKRMGALLRQWEEADTISRASGAFVPIWRVSPPGIFSSQTKLSITTPPMAVAPPPFYPVGLNPVPPAYYNGMPGQGYAAPGGYYPPYPVDEKRPEGPEAPAPVTGYTGYTFDRQPQP